MPKTKILLTGGGTAGHIWPIVALCQELKKTDYEYLYVGAAGLDEQIALENKINFKAVSVGKLRPYISVLNLIDPFKTAVGLIQAFSILKKFKPNAIFSKGGYVTFPILYWAKKWRIPVVAHESDAVVGKSNRWASSFAKTICLGYPIEFYNFDNLPRDKFIYTGIPVREEFFQVKAEPHKLPTILITGGSQGAQKINNVIKEILKDLTAKYDVYHLTGSLDYEKFAKIKNSRYHCFAFTPDMASLMAQADLVISRAGSTLAEISALGKPSILIPLPTAAGDHQSANAMIYQQKNAAEVLEEKHLTSNILHSMIVRLMASGVLRDRLGQNARELSVRDASKKVVDIIIEAGQK